MKLFRFSFLVLALPVLLLFSCSTDNTTSTPVSVSDSAYFPLRKGHFVEYHVDSTYWDDFLGTETHYFLDLRYAISDTLTDLQGRPTYSITVSQRKDATEGWRLQSTFQTTTTQSQLEWVQDNIRFVKLKFPVVNGKTWLGNEFISTLQQDRLFYRDWHYTYADVAASYNNGFKTFNNTLTVNQVDDTLNNPEQSPAAYAYRTFGREKYALNVGLIEKQFVHWTYDPGVAAARKGTAVTMKAFNYNN